MIYRNLFAIVNSTYFLYGFNTFVPLMMSTLYVSQYLFGIKFGICKKIYKNGFYLKSLFFRQFMTKYVIFNFRSGGNNITNQIQF